MTGHADDELPQGSLLLRGQYEVGPCLAYGGFGITYLARDSLERQVVLKECYPSALCSRDGPQVSPNGGSGAKAYKLIVQNFVAEARRLAKLDHPNIVRVHQVFEENGTAYMAMDFVPGEELLDVLDNAPERLTPDLIQRVLRNALSALDYIHSQGVLHRDISPDNILLDDEDHLTLIDFGSALDVAGQKARVGATMLAVKEGYSPHEFYVENAKQNEASDLYSLAATFYHLITGNAPSDGFLRYDAIEHGDEDPYAPLAGGKWPYDKTFLELIDRALRIEPLERISSAREWLGELGEEAEDHGRNDDHRLLPLAGLHARQIESQSSEVLPAELLDQVISEMVKASSAEPEPPRPVQPAPKPAPQPVVRSEPQQEQPQKVDIFGNPIEDVDAWLKEQDRSRWLRKGKASKTKVQPEQEEKPAQKSFVRRFLSSGLGRRGDDDSVARN